MLCKNVFSQKCNENKNYAEVFEEFIIILRINLFHLQKLFSLKYGLFSYLFICEPIYFAYKRRLDRNNGNLKCSHFVGGADVDPF